MPRIAKAPFKRGFCLTLESILRIIQPYKLKVCMKNLHLKLLVSAVLIITSVVVYTVLRVKSDASWADTLALLSEEFPVPLLIGLILSALYVPWGSLKKSSSDFSRHRQKGGSSLDSMSDSSPRGPSAVGLDRNANVTADPSTRLTDL